MGYLVNPVVLRADLSGDPSLTAFLRQVSMTVLAALDHQAYPFPLLVERLQPNRDLSRSPIFSVLFNLIRPLCHDMLQMAQIVAGRTGTPMDLGELVLEPFALQQQTAQFDLTLLIIDTDTTLSCSWEYNTDLFDETTILRMADYFQMLLAHSAGNPTQRLSTLPPLPQVDGGARARVSATRPQAQTIAIAATFTAEPLEESLAFWMQELTLPFNTKFAPYNQLFQQLLDPTSLLSQNQHGINVVLVRIEDWQRLDNRDEEVDHPFGMYEVIERNVHDLVNALRSVAQHSDTPYMVYLCPASPTANADARYSEFLARLEERIVTDLADVSGVYVTKSAAVSATYPVPTYYDRRTDELAHVPFTPLFFTALGTFVARNIYAFLNAPRKVIVLDCDQTLWTGVCGEDGPHGVEIDGPRRALQEFIIAQHDAGMLICLCSKNNEKDVLEVFECHPEMPLKREHIVSWRVNWQAKSENLKALAEEFHVALDSFIFVDDDPVECAEIQARCPEVLVLQLPRDVSNLPRFLEHVWAFDHLRITEEDEKRTALYRQQKQRQSFQTESLTLEDFLAGLDMRVQVTAMDASHLTRVAQLTQRTNQFNITTIRRSESDLGHLCQIGHGECLVVEVRDHFGDYGLVGVIIFTTEADAITVDTFLLSCRAMGRGVEHRMLSSLGAIAQERHVPRVRVRYRPTAKNKPALDFLDSIGATLKQRCSDGWAFDFPADYVSELVYKPPTDAPLSSRDIAATQSLAPVPAPDVATETRRIATHLSMIATEMCGAEQVHQIVSSRRRRMGGLQQPTVAPRTDTEARLADIWAQVLGLEQIGIFDNFFALGGHSLLAIQLLSQVWDVFQAELSLSSVFETPTVAELAIAIVERRAVQADDGALRQVLAELEDLSEDDVQTILGANQHTT